MKKIIKYIKNFLVLREEDKLHMLPWELIKYIVSKPSAYKMKGKIEIPQDSRWNWKRKRTVKQSK